MTVGKPSKLIKRICKSKGVEIDEENINLILDEYHHLMHQKLVAGEIVKIATIGKISTSIAQGVSRLTKEEKEYETVKFKFTPFVGIKSEAKKRLTEVQKKHL